MKRSYYHNRQILDKYLMALLGSEELVDKWWNSNNKAFFNNKPKDYIETEQEAVENYIRGFCSM